MLTLNELVYSKLKNMLIMYKLVPGQKLQYQDLADLLKVSRFPVQSALSMLAKEGFLKLIPNKGYYVKEITIEEMLELYEIRELLEMHAIKNAVGHIGPDLIKQLEDKKIGYEDSLRESLSRNRFIKDIDFHLKLSELGGNSNLTLMLKQVLERMFFTYTVELLSNDRGTEVCRQHEDIFNAARTKDIPGAIRYTKCHIKTGKDYMLDALKLTNNFYMVDLQATDEEK